MFWKGLREFPGTPAGIATVILLEILYTVTLLALIAFDRKVNIEATSVLGGFILTVGGKATWQYRIGRKTDRKLNEILATGPSPVTVEAPAQVNVAADPAKEAPSVEVQPLVSQSVVADGTPSRRTIAPLLHRESEAD